MVLLSNPMKSVELSMPTLGFTYKKDIKMSISKISFNNMIVTKKIAQENDIEFDQKSWGDLFVDSLRSEEHKKHAKKLDYGYGAHIQQEASKLLNQRQSEADKGLNPASEQVVNQFLTSNIANDTSHQVDLLAMEPSEDSLGTAGVELATSNITTISLESAAIGAAAPPKVLTD